VPSDFQAPSTPDAPSCEHKSDGAEEELVVDQLRQGALAQEVKPRDVIRVWSNKGQSAWSADAKGEQWAHER
jgi:hypothetical protein